MTTNPPQVPYGLCERGVTHGEHVWRDAIDSPHRCPGYKGPWEPHAPASAPETPQPVSAGGGDGSEALRVSRRRGRGSAPGPCLVRPRHHRPAAQRGVGLDRRPPRARVEEMGQ